MGKTTGITWTHSTFNGWIGCEHAPMEDGSTNPLCDNCYAELQNGFRKWNGGEWGPGAARKLTSVHNWNEPFRWDKEAALGGEQRRVFAFSLGDIFDVAAPNWPEDRQLPGLGPAKFLKDLGGYDKTPDYMKTVSARTMFLINVVARTPHLTWLLLTKRFQACAELLKLTWPGKFPSNIWVIFSAGTQDGLDEAMPWLRQINASVCGISAEPLLEDLDIGGYVDDIDWMITGGESGPNARRMDPQWNRSIRRQCEAAGIPYFLKQTGAVLAKEMGLSGAGADPSQWPEAMRVQQFPGKST